MGAAILMTDSNASRALAEFDIALGLNAKLLVIREYLARTVQDELVRAETSARQVELSKDTTGLPEGVTIL